MNTSAAGREQLGQGRRSGLECGLPLQVLEIFTLAADDGIQVQVVSYYAAEGDTTGGTEMPDRDMGLEETLGMGWLMKRREGCSKHIPTCTLLGICSTCHSLPLKSLEVRMSLSNDVS
jgi:hypothetical protein